MSSASQNRDPDAAALRRASRSVGLQITLASSILLLLAIATAFAFVFAHIEPSRVLTRGHRESTIDVGTIEILAVALLIGVAGIVVAGLVSWVIARRAIRPLGEVLRLQRNFVSDASHELRTPLAVLDARLQQLQRSLVSDDPAGETVAELRRDTGILVQIVNDLLVTAEENGAPVAGTPIEVETVAQLAVDSMGILAEEHGVTITLAAEPMSVLAPAASVHRSLVALLDNALRFAPRGSIVSVTLSGDRTTVELRVADQGPGISGLETDRVFDRFARGTGGDPQSGGFGIGLALVRTSLLRYGGSAQVESTGSSGTTMLLRLPRARR